MDNETISRYLNHICDAFLFYRAYRYDIKGKEYLKTQNKYYAADMGLRNAAIHYRQIEITNIIENLVYLASSEREARDIANSYTKWKYSISRESVGEISKQSHRELLKKQIELLNQELEILGEE